MISEEEITVKEIIPIERALTVVEPEQEPEPEPAVESEFDDTLPVPPMFSIYQIPKDGAPLPVAPHPYYPISKDGMYLYRKLLIGHGYVPQKTLPKTLKSIGENTKGLFYWTAPPVPAEVCASIVSFFRHIFEKQRTEAEVLLLIHKETMEWKVWIPTQEVSYSGVKSVYEPADIPKGYVLVGTMHSHCDFGAFHSGTDTNDAREFDGLHITIGKIMEDKPEIAAMVMMNKVQFIYDEDVHIVADFSNLEAGETLPEWDEYVTVNSSLTSGHKPKGWELFDKYKPAPTYTYKPPTTMKPSWWEDNKDNTKYTGWSGSRDHDYRSMTDEEWDALFERKYNQNKPESLWEKLQKSQNAKDLFADDYWEDGLPQGLADIILDSGTLQEEDFDHITQNYEDGVNPFWWKSLYLKKFARTVGVLEALGLSIEYHVKTKKLGEK